MLPRRLWSKVMSLREPVLHSVPIADLRPTQMTVGLREVEAKRQSWREREGGRAEGFLGSHMIPAIKGPKARLYIIDHHHLVRALHDEGQKQVFVNVIADVSWLSTAAFWVVCEHRNWAHPYDSEGRRRSIELMPKRIEKLEDDPYRSLAGELRRLGGFAKDVTPYSEFLWADFLRRRIGRRLVDADFEKALKKALKLAKGQEASYLAGWCGPVKD
jgi:hypothetical protein